MVNEVEVEDPNAEPDKECVYTIDHEVNVVNLSQSGCEVNNIKEKKTAREWDPRTREWDPRTQEQTARGWDPRTQEQTAREWDPRTHESLVMVDSGASVNVCPKSFGNTKLEQSDDATCLRGANGKPPASALDKVVTFAGEVLFEKHPQTLTKPEATPGDRIDMRISGQLEKQKHLPTPLS